MSKLSNNRTRCTAVLFKLNALIFLIIAAMVVTAQTPPYGVSAMLRLDSLPYLSSIISAGQQSSYDRSGGNDDSKHFLYAGGGENVMLD
ncbi:MAG: hypothetical protein PHC61_03590, partial [Chitinivibrionales bacterium]|nr:hypothetical protein [Chitinivibrionales bacterium]